MSTHKHNETKVAAKTAASTEKKHDVKLPFVFSRMNYVFTAVSLAVLTLGFVLMSGSKGDIYDFRRITLAPIVVIIGFVFGFVAIFYKEKSSDKHEQA